MMIRPAKKAHASFGLIAWLEKEMSACTIRSADARPLAPRCRR
ncbi:hypothetical protein [Burkholderia latens]|nr:hypothetical protein [Burkholderia latens]